jgi:hypothetical protein
MIETLAKDHPVKLVATMLRRAATATRNGWRMRLVAREVLVRLSPGTDPYPRRWRMRSLLTATLLALAASAAPAQQRAPAPAVQTADSILKEMSRITGLPIKAPLKKELVSKTEIERYLKENLHAEYTPEEIHGQEAALKAFGLVAADFDLGKFLISFYTEQAAGFYDPRRKTMFMADWVAPELQKLVLAHELTHALQDQNFDLWKFMHATRDNDDASAAREALVEGYATLAMMQEMLQPAPVEKLPSLDALLDQLVSRQMEEYPVFSHAPFFLRFEMLFPYVQGMSFNRRGLTRGGWKRLNQTFTDPPASTKQIFQPDLYFGLSAAGGSAAQGDPAGGEMELPPPPTLEHASGWKRVEANVMGELGYQALLGQLVSAKAAQVTESWVADRYLVYEGPTSGQYVLIARTRWSSPEAAASFCGDYRAILEKRGSAPASKAEPGTSGSDHGSREGLLRLGGTRPAIFWQGGEECRWAEGVPSAEADTMANWLESLH